MSPGRTRVLLVAFGATLASAGGWAEAQEPRHRPVDRSGPSPVVPRPGPILSSGVDVAVGDWPSQLVVVGHDAYVLNKGRGTGSLSVVDLEARRVVASFAGFNAPDTISVSADGSTVFLVSLAKPVSDLPTMCDVRVIDFQNGWLTLFDTASRSLRKAIEIPHEPFLAVPAPDGLVYVATLSGPVHKVDPETGAVLATYPMGVGQLEDLTVGPDGKKLFAAAGPVLDAILVVDTATGSTRSVRLDALGLVIFFGGRMTIDPSGSFLFVNVLDGSHGSTAVISTVEERVLGVVPQGFGGLAFSPSGTLAYLLDPNYDWRQGLVVRLPSLDVVGHLPVGGPDALLSADGSTLYFIEFGGDFRRELEMFPGFEQRYDVGALHLPTGRLRHVDVSPAPVSCTFERALKLTSDGRYLVVSNPALNDVTVFDLAASSGW